MNSFNKDFSLFAKDRGISSMNLNEYNKFITRNSYIDPSIIEERQMNVTQISVFSRLFMERILFLGSEINDDVANIINSQLLFLEMTDPEKDITMYINSPGGSVYAGLSIYDVFKYVSCPIATTCIGMSASMGAVLLSSGDKGKRFSLPNSQIMIHQPSGGTGRVQASDLKISWEQMDKCQNTLYKILSENTGKDIDIIKDDCDRDHWLTSEEAKTYGLIDNIIEAKKK